MHPNQQNLNYEMRWMGCDHKKYLVAFSIHSTKHGHLWSSNKQEPFHFAMFFYFTSIFIWCTNFQIFETILKLVFMCVLNKLLIWVCLFEGVIDYVPHYARNELGYLFFTLVVNNKMMVTCCYHGVQMHQLQHLLLNIFPSQCLNFPFD